MGEPLSLYKDIVKPEWIDYNGHMSEAYYVLTFGFASEAFLDHIGAGENYRVLTGRSIYTVEAHINYLREVKEGAKLNFVTHILNFDSRRIHLFHTMYTDSNDQAIATTELMELHVDEQPRVSNMPEDILRKVREVFENHRELEIPSNVGRRINIGG